MSAVLALNATYLPIRVISTERAVGLLYTDRARQITGTGRFLRSQHLTIEAPSVVAFNRNVRVPDSVVPPYSKRGVLMRDQYRCAYCGERGSTIDHVVPQSLGGPDSWENCVAACGYCNNKKDSRTLAQLGWTLPFTPKAPSPVLAPFLWLASTPEAWREYLDPHMPRRVFAAVG